MVNFAETYQNNPAKRGQQADAWQFVDAACRYTVAPIHTMFDAVEWIVLDTWTPDEDGLKVVRQASTLENAITNL